MISYRGTKYTGNDIQKKFGNTVVQDTEDRVWLITDDGMAILFDEQKLAFSEDGIMLDAHYDLLVKHLLPDPGFYNIDGTCFHLKYKNRYQWKMGCCGDRVTISALSTVPWRQGHDGNFFKRAAQAFKKEIHYYPKIEQAINEFLCLGEVPTDPKLLPPRTFVALTRNLLLSGMGSSFNLLLHNKQIPVTIAKGLLVLPEADPLLSELKEELYGY